MNASTEVAVRPKDQLPTLPQAAAVKLASTSGSEACPREKMIAEAAYFRAEKRGFAPGNELADWFQAEAEIATAPAGAG